MTDPRKSERERREAALAAAGGEMKPEARKIPGGSIRQMLSVRMEPALIRELRRVAKQRGVSVSDLVRTAVVRMLAAEQKQAASRVMFEVIPGGQAQTVPSVVLTKPISSTGGSPQGQPQPMTATG